MKLLQWKWPRTATIFQATFSWSCWKQSETDIIRFCLKNLLFAYKIVLLLHDFFHAYRTTQRKIGKVASSKEQRVAEDEFGESEFQNVSYYCYFGFCCRILMKVFKEGCIPLFYYIAAFFSSELKMRHSNWCLLRVVFFFCLENATVLRRSPGQWSIWLSVKF